MLQAVPDSSFFECVKRKDWEAAVAHPHPCAKTFCTLSSDMWKIYQGAYRRPWYAPLTQRLTKANICKENLMKPISDQGLGCPQPWLGPGLAMGWPGGNVAS